MMSPLCNSQASQSASPSCLCCDQLQGEGGCAAAAGYVIRVQARSYLVLAEHISLGDAVQQGVGNLASSTGHNNTDWFSLEGNKQVWFILYVSLTYINNRGMRQSSSSVYCCPELAESLFFFFFTH